MSPQNNLHHRYSGGNLLVLLKVFVVHPAARRSKGGDAKTGQSNQQQVKRFPIPS